jgi:dimethylglycine dehydrogenase
MQKLGAVFGSVYGWERPNWFTSNGYGIDVASLEKPDVLTNENHPKPDASGKVKEIWSFRRSNYFEPVGQEIRNVTENVGLQDMSPFAKAIVSGKGARSWLDSILANRIPKTRGRIALCHLLTKNGGVRAEFTVYERAPDEFYLVSAGALERHDHDILRKLLPKNGSVNFESVTQAYGVLVLAGPRSRDVLRKLTDMDLSNAAFPWLSGKPISVGPIGLHALRVNFVGELGWELHHPIAAQNALFDLLMEAGGEFGIKPFGIRAMLSMAVEKSYRLVGRELSIEYAALESGLDRFVHLNKGEFLGRDALVHWREKGFANRFVTLELEDVTDTDARGSEPIRRNGEIIGRCTSGGYGWRVRKSLALAMVRPDLGEIGSELEVTLLGKPHRAVVTSESPFDPLNERLRG